jgi:hypothetical protein
VKPVANTSPQDQIQQRPISNDVTAPQPEVEISEESNDTEEGAQQLEEPAEPAAVSDEGNADNTLRFGSESADASSEENTAAAEAGGEEDGPEEGNQQNEETESSSGG